VVDNFFWFLIYPLSRKMMDHFVVFKLYVIRKVFFGKKCVCDIEKRKREYGSKFYFDYCDGKWLMDFHISCWCLVIFKVWKERKEWFILILHKFLLLLCISFSYLHKIYMPSIFIKKIWSRKYQLLRHDGSYH
jgi:hypothetical protein